MAWRHSRRSTVFARTIQPDVHPPSHPAGFGSLPDPATAPCSQPRPARACCAGAGSPKARKKIKKRMEKKKKRQLISQVLTPVLLRFARYGYGWAFSPSECIAAHSSGEDGKWPGGGFCWAVLAHVHCLAHAFWRDGMKFSATPIPWALISDISAFHLSVACWQDRWCRLGTWTPLLCLHTPGECCWKQLSVEISGWQQLQDSCSWGGCISVCRGTVSM